MRFGIRYLGIAAMVITVGVWLAASRPATGGVSGPLRVHPTNARYFADTTGALVYLTGFHDGWELQDYAWGDPAEGDHVCNWKGLLDSLTRHKVNVIRLWCVEHTKMLDSDKDLTTPMPYERVAGRGKARDGGDKFDLDRFDETYFRRLRLRVREAGQRGLYVIVMLFQGWSIEDKAGKVNPWPYHPFNSANNISGIDGDPNRDGKGTELHTWLGEDNPVTKRQRAYVRKVIDTVNDLDRVLYEIANESGTYSTEWQYRMIDFIKQHERGKTKRHLVGMTSQGGGMERSLLDSPADWISPGSDRGLRTRYRNNPPEAKGPKPSLLDTDHIFGYGLKDYKWVWKSFCRGHNPIYMDRWTVEPNDPGRKMVRLALGQAAGLAAKIDLARMTPRSELASTGYCLAAPGREYVVYIPDGGKARLNLKDARGKLSSEWFSPRTGEFSTGASVRGGAVRTLNVPFDGDGVLWLRRQSQSPES